MSDDVRAAAERLRRIESGERMKAVYGFEGEKMDPFNSRMLENCYTRDLRQLAEAWLREHPADDGLPLTVDWLLSVGGSDCGLKGISFLLPPVDDDCAIVELCIAGHWNVTLNQGMPDDPRSMPDIVLLTSLPDALTRGHVRRLATALGITLNERTDG